jgi:hypothetical protein
MQGLDSLLATLQKSQCTIIFVFHFPFVFSTLLFLAFEMTFFSYRNKRKHEILKKKKEINIR